MTKKGLIKEFAKVFAIGFPLLFGACAPAKKTSNLIKLLEEERISYTLNDKINTNPGFPPGGVSYVDWVFKKDFERLDVNVKINQFDTSKDFYLQFYQSKIGNDGFYFGIQNRVNTNDQMLIFSRWRTRDLANVKVNVAKKGFSQSAGYEGNFVGVRLPNFELKRGEYNFSIFKEKDDDVGRWYKYMVTEKSTNTETWGGSIRFDKNSKINRKGSTWTELFGKPWPVQTYKHLPNWDVEILIKGNNKSPIHATSSYTDPNWGDHIPMENISYDVSTRKVRKQLGKDVIRKNRAGMLF